MKEKIVLTLLFLFGERVLVYLQQQKHQPTELLDYPTAVKSLVRHQPRHIAFERAVLLREQDEQGDYFVSALYLDKDNQPVQGPDGNVAGYTLRARSLDQELNEAFGNSNILIME